MRPKKPNMTHLQKIVDEFNQKYPVGTAVILRKDSGELITKVRGSMDATRSRGE
jgi:hypothetical protein